MSHLPKTEGDPLGPAFAWRLRAALDRVVPASATPRYQSVSSAPTGPLRFAPVALVLALTGVLALTAFATTGSANPMVWTERATSTIESVGHAPEVLPSPEPAAGPERESPRPPAAAAPAHTPEHEASPRPEPSELPEHSPSPEPSWSPGPGGDHSGTSSPGPSPSPSPTPHDG